MLAKYLALELRNIDLSDTYEIAPEETVEYIEWLMKWYCQSPSRFLANIIVSRLEGLKHSMQNGEVVSSDWSCQRLLKNWQYIARNHKTSGQL